MRVCYSIISKRCSYFFLLIAFFLTTVKSKTDYYQYIQVQKVFNMIPEYFPTMYWSGTDLGGYELDYNEYKFEATPKSL